MKKMANENRLIDALVHTEDDLISRRALIAEYDRVHVGKPGGARKLMEDAPAVDTVEVVHGSWRWCGSDRWNDAYQCSNCGKIAMNDSNYCPNCGAKMDGDKHE